MRICSISDSHGQHNKINIPDYKTDYFNCSVVDRFYKLTNKLMIVDYEN